MEYPVTDDTVRRPAPAGTLVRLRRYQEAEREFRAYIGGLLDALGVSQDRLIGIDEGTCELLLAPEPEPVPDSDDEP